MINGEKIRVAGHETYQVTRHKFKIQNQVDFPVHGLNLIDRMRYVKINEDCGKRGFYLVVSIFRKEVSKIKCKWALNFRTDFKSSLFL